LPGSFPGGRPADSARHEMVKRLEAAINKIVSQQCSIALASEKIAECIENVVFEESNCSAKYLSGVRKHIRVLSENEQAATISAPPVPATSNGVKMAATAHETGDLSLLLDSEGFLKNFVQQGNKFCLMMNKKLPPEESSGRKGKPAKIFKIIAQMQEYVGYAIDCLGSIRKCYTGWRPSDASLEKFRSALHQIKIIYLKINRSLDAAQHREVQQVSRAQTDSAHYQYYENSGVMKRRRDNLDHEQHTFSCGQYESFDVTKRHRLDSDSAQSLLSNTDTSTSGSIKSFPSSPGEKTSSSESVEQKPSSNDRQSWRSFKDLFQSFPELQSTTNANMQRVAPVLDVVDNITTTIKTSPFQDFEEEGPLSF